MKLSIVVVILAFLISSCNQKLESNALDNLPVSINFQVNDTLKGNDLIQKLAYISQNDQLDSTLWDEYRCSAAAALNCYLYMGGSWGNLATRLNLADTAFTYTNIYQAQEKLFLISGGDSSGVLGQYYPNWNDAGELTGYTVKSNNVLSFVFENLDMYIKPILPSKISDPQQMKVAIAKMYKEPVLPNPVMDIKNKEQEVLKYFELNPNGALFMGVNENSKTEESLPAIDERISSQNHYIMCFKKGGNFYTLDTWRTPGKIALTKLTDRKVDEMLFKTHNMLLAMYFK